MTNEIYEVFAETHPHHWDRHIGSVRAPTPTLAVQMAREIYFRREVCQRIGVVKREQASTPDQICWSDAPELVLTQRNYEKEYRKPGFFTRRRQETSKEGNVERGD